MPGKIWKFLSSMRFAVILLIILAVACISGSFVDVFHSWWFVLITLFLCLNLLLCNVLRFPSILKACRAKVTAEDLEKRLEGRMALGTGILREEALERTFSGLGFHRVKDLTAADGKSVRYAEKNKAGLWGAWVCHLGILLLILGFALGQMTKKEYTVYGVPGQSKQVGDTDIILTIDDFTIDLREDDTVEQYTAVLTARNAATGEKESGTASVNYPCRMFGMKFYQNSTGWAAAVTILKDGEQIQQEVICAGEYVEVEDKDGLIILFSAFYPDYVMDPERGPMSASGLLNNPGYLYRAYYQDQVIGMNVLTGDDVITIDEYTVIFSDPQPYTLIQVKKDRFTLLALLGGLVVLAGLFLAFYLQPARMWAVKQADGSWKVTGASRKGGALFDERLKEEIRRGGGTVEEAGVKEGTGGAEEEAGAKEGTGGAAERSQDGQRTVSGS